MGSRLIPTGADQPANTSTIFEENAQVHGRENLCSNKFVRYGSCDDKVLQNIIFLFTVFEASGNFNAFGNFSTP